MPNYSKSKIYKIYSLNKPELIYIGSTTQKLSQRLAGHMGKYKMWKQGKSHHVSSFKVIGAGNHRIELIEEYPCENKEQLLKKEGQYIRKIDCVNKIVAGRTKKQYKEENYEKIQIQNRKYAKENSEKIQDYKKKHYEENKEIVLNKCKEYYEKNADKVRARVNKYREENVEKVKARKNKVVICPLCGMQSTSSHLRRHQRSSACTKE